MKAALLLVNLALFSSSASAMMGMHVGRGRLTQDYRDSEYSRLAPRQHQHVRAPDRSFIAECITQAHSEPGVLVWSRSQKAYYGTCRGGSERGARGEGKKVGQPKQADEIFAGSRVHPPTHSSPQPTTQSP